MPEFSTAKSLDEMPEAFVSDTAISREVSRAAKAGRLRKLASRLYTRNLSDQPETVIRRNLWNIVGGYFPGALIADRTALENAPAKDGSVCLVAERGNDVKLPGLVLRPRRGTGPLPTDRPFIAGLFLSSTARAYLENMRASRARGDTLARTLTRREIEERLDTLIRRSGEDAAKRLRDEVRAVAPALDMKEEAAELDALIGTLLGTRDENLSAPTALARRKGRPYDPDRLVLFQKLHTALRNHPPITRLAPERGAEATATLAFFEAYFSNFIEGTEFAVEEAADIVFRGVIPNERPEDAHDVLGTWRIVSDAEEMRRTPQDGAALVRLLRARHAAIMEGRPDKRPGEFKLAGNRAGHTVFVAPDLVDGTLDQGFSIFRSLETPFQRAVFAMFLVAEVHPFADGNGRTARIMMNAELVAAGEERIVIPTVYRSNYLSALKALSQNGLAEPLIRMLDFAQRWTAAIDWRTVEETRRELDACNAFLDPNVADEEGKRLRMPTGVGSLTTMDKRSLSERDICTKFITPKIVSAGWDLDTQIREEVSFTKGRIIVRGKLVSRGQAKRADYVLYYKPNIPLAIIEAKDNSHSVGDGMQQGLEYAATLSIPFVFSSNGDGFVFHDRTAKGGATEVNLALDGFPPPADLWARYRAWKGLTPDAEQIVLQDYFDDGGGKAPRYYQVNAVNAAIEAIAKGQNRILLVMATGTGKTYTAFQILWRLWKSGRKKRILYLADRNVLIDQTMVNDFRPFGAAMAKLSTGAHTIERADGTTTELTTALDDRRRIDTSYEIYLGLYQAITGPEERQKLFREFSPGFFDLIVIDECHRGSAAEDSAWREILEYFSAATQIGMTATPKETKYISNIAYFGDPVYSYSLKEGIRDGFLAPYKVVKVHIDRDVEGYRPEKGQLDREGEEVEDRIYNTKDFDRMLVLDDRTKLVAKKITEFLKESGDRYQKTIVFCVDQEHAGRMRQALINENADLVAENHRYVMRITGNDKEGQDQLGNFIDPESKWPVLVTTSRLLSTGVDAQTCRLIVLDREVGSMTEFKQIVGRGTRVHEDTKKFYFTLIDFRGASSHFADPDFDGEPVQIYEPGPGDPVAPPDDVPPTGEDGETLLEKPGIDETIVDQPGLPLPPGGGPLRKIYVDGVGATIIAERVEYLDENGKLVTESLRDFTKAALKKRFASLDAFLKRWKAAERKQVIIEELEAEGLPLDPIAEELGKDLDPFDLICHVAFDKKPLTRRERAENVKKRDVFTKYGGQARAVLDALLAKYADEGVLNLDDTNVLKIAPFTAMGTPVQLIKAFGDRQGFEQAVHELQSALYQEVA